MQPLPTLSVFADLTIDLNGHPLRVSGEGNRIVVETERVLDLLNGMKSPTFGSGRTFIRTLAKTLHGFNVTLEIRRRGSPVVRIGAVASGWLTRLLGLPHVRIGG